VARHYCWIGDGKKVEDCTAEPEVEPVIEPTNCRSDLCTDIGSDCCAPGTEARGCSKPGYFVFPDHTGKSGYEPCVGSYGQDSVY
jgi:hypothetical protein